MGSGRADLATVWKDGMVLCLCELLVWILCVDVTSRYLYTVLGGYLHILDAPSVQSCCTLPKSRLVCVWLSDLNLSRHRPLL